MPILPPATIDWRDGTTPRSTLYNDVYYSAENGLEESQHTFLRGVGITATTWPKHLTTIGELGLGTGLNLLATAKAYHQHSQSHPLAPLHYIAIEGHPLDPVDLVQALTPWNNDTDLGTVTAHWQAAWAEHFKQPQPKQPRVITLTPWQPLGLRVTVTIIVADIDDAFTHWPPATWVDGWYLDGFAPATNPAMWTEDVFTNLAQRSRLEARLATFTVAGQVRRGLAKAGFTLDKRPGYGSKRECLSGIYHANNKG